MVERHAEVGKDAVDRVDLVVSHEVDDKSEVGVHDGEAAVGHGAADGVHVLVEAVEMPFLRQSGDDGARMASATVGHVDIRAVGTDVERLYGLRQQGGYMINIFRHVSIVLRSDGGVGWRRRMAAVGSGCLYGCKVTKKLS